MKTPEEKQAAINDVRRVLEAHGVVLIPIISKEGATYLIHDAEDMENHPEPLYTTWATDLSQPDRARTLQSFNTVRQFAEGHVVGGIGTVKGYIAPLITVHKYSHALSDINTSDAVVVPTLNEVTQLDFVRQFVSSRFKRFVISLEDGPFGTLIAEYNGHADMVVGFIEGVEPDDLLKKWPKKGADNGGV